MLRLLLLNAFLFLAPFGAFAVWTRYRRGRWPLRTDWTTGTILVLGAIGAVIMIIGLILVALEPIEVTAQAGAGLA